MKNIQNRGFTLVEIIVAATLSGIVLAGVMSSFLMFVKSSIRISNYDQMETQTTRGLELLARDIRMAQLFVSDAPTGIASARDIREITLDVPNSAGVVTKIIYKFDSTQNTLTRKIGSAAATNVVTDIVPGTGQFLAYNFDQTVISGTNQLQQTRAANDYETSQVQISMTLSPDSKGNYASTTKRVISARFVLRNYR